MEKHKDRLRYIEPNIILDEDGKQLDNVPYLPEDYNMSVDIQVVCPSRRDCYGSVGGVNVSNLSTKMESVENGNRFVSFMSGNGCSDGTNKNDDLTTSYLDISFTDNKTYKENLGIQSIDITFDATFTPRVKISFVDVRGNALMNPAENDYMSEDKSEYSNFFQALFHFPYPQFFMTIKGYYGTPVTFMLAVQNFKSSFDSNSGNFLVNVDFIGYKYGLYTDIPFNVLLSAPYYSKERWENIKKSCTFDGNKEMLSLVEFMERSNNLERYLQEINVNENSATNRKKSLEDEKTALIDLKTDWLTFVNSIRSEKTYTTNYINSKGYSYKVFYAKVVKDGDKIINNFPYSVNVVNDFLRKNEEYIKKYKNNKHYKGFAGYGSPVFIAEDGTLYKHNKTKKSINDELCIYTYDGSFKSSRFVKNEYNSNGKLKKYGYWTGGVKIGNVYLHDVIKDILKNENYKGEIAVFLTLSIDQEIDKAIAKIENELRTATDESNEEIRTAYKRSFHFTPHIGNTFFMFFAHLKCFMEIFYDTLDTIKSQITNNQRTCSELGVDTENSDIQNGVLCLPPFPSFYKINEENGRKEEVFPDTDVFPNGYKLEEVKFVEQFYQSIIKAKIESNDTIIKDEIQKEQFETPNIETGFNPTNFFDKDKKINPYGKIKGYNSAMLGEALFVLTERIGLSYLTSDDGNLDSNVLEGIVRDESKNFISQYPNVTTEEFRGIIKNSKNKAYEILFNFCKNNSNLIENKTSRITFDNKNKTLSLRTNVININFLNLRTDVDYEIFGEPKIIRFNNGSEEYTAIETLYDRKDKCDEETVKFFDSMIIENEITKNRKTEEPSYDVFWTILDMNTDNVELNVLNFFRGLFSYYTNDIKGSEYEYMISYLVDSFNNEGKFKILNCPNFLLYYLGCLFVNYERLFDSEKRGISPLNGTEIRKLCSDIYNNWKKTSDYQKLKKYLSNTVPKDFGIWESLKYNVQAYTKKHIYNGKENYDDLFENFYKKSYIVFYYKNDSNGVNDIVINNDYLNHFIDKLIEYYCNKDHVSTEQKYNNTAKELKDKPNKEVYLALYLTFKDLYNKWLCSYDRNVFDLESYNTEKVKRNNRFGYKNEENATILGLDKVNEFNNFVFIDSCYSDISDKFFIDPKTIASVLLNHYNGVENWSFFQFFSELCAKNNILLNCLPMYRNITDDKSISDMFKPHPLKGMEHTLGNTYVLMYTYKPSSGSGNDDYSDDTIQLHSMDSNPTPYNEELYRIDENSEGDMIVPAFGVTYGRQNQNIFKSINVSMDNPITTDIAIMNTFLLAGVTENGATNKTNTIANNLYNIYSNRAYTATVSMMGCANIMPMMMFQLNNIPLFRGAYMITKVQHSIKAGNFTTTFTGVRISPKHLPLNMNTYPILDAEYNGDVSYEGQTTAPCCEEPLTANENIASITQNKYIDMGVLLNSETIQTFNDKCGTGKLYTVGDISHKQCVSGPSTWYIKAVKAKGKNIAFNCWWTPDDNKTANTSHIDRVGFVVVDSTNAQMTNKEANKWIDDHINRSDEYRLKQGDVITMHGYRSDNTQSSHAVMYYGGEGKMKYLSDYKQEKAFPYNRTRGNLTIWRFSDADYESKVLKKNA